MAQILGGIPVQPSSAATVMMASFVGYTGRGACTYCCRNIDRAIRAGSGLQLVFLYQSISDAVFQEFGDFEF